MKKILILACSILMYMTATAQSDFDRAKDAESNYEIYKGELTFEDLKDAGFDWMENAKDYKANDEAVDYLQKHLKDYKLVVFLGTWCSDSHEMIPKLYSVLQQASYPMNQLKMYGVDRAKESKYFDHKTYKIVSVPTVIVMKGAFEQGRIVETADKSVEQHLAKIIKDSMKRAEQ